MRPLKIIIKDTTEFQVHLIDLNDIRDIVCTYPRSEVASDVPEDIESSIENGNGQKIEFKFSDNETIEVDLDKTEAKFILYDSNGSEIGKTGDLEELEQLILDSIVDDSIQMTAPDSDDFLFSPPAAA